MTGKVQKWGNSQAVRLPKVLLDEIGLKENDEVEIRIVGGGVAIFPVRRHKTLEERIAEYQGDYRGGEWDSGAPRGEEVL